jgi:hypothetical protein
MSAIAIKMACNFAEGILIAGELVRMAAPATLLPDDGRQLAIVPHLPTVR